MRKTFALRILWIVLVVILLASVLPHLIKSYWLIDIFSNFKIQLLITSILLVLPTLILLRKQVLAVLILGINILWNLYFIIPYYIETTIPVTENHFKVTSINLLSSNSNKQLTSKFIKNESPDILILMELTPEWLAYLEPVIADYKYKEIVPRNDNFGIALLSKYKMTSSVDYFSLNDKPSIIANVSILQQQFTIVATHPVPPIGQQSFLNRNKQLSNIASNIPGYSKNLIIAGDFNTSSFSPHFDSLLKQNLKDSRIGSGLLPTWPADYKLLQTTLDHFVVSKHLQISKRATGPNIGSDHLPITMSIGLEAN
ncbi:endonuclease/exonuclease/phosphatase family protein [Christiangramia sp. ASW11-125]|uniref:endonuclease/exonuclease/phosphatase family protein n=1 Tax=Christiangramia sp. ASW11-125 TaxID=3400701 RepID=UPI003AACF40A